MREDRQRSARPPAIRRARLLAAAPRPPWRSALALLAAACVSGCGATPGPTDAALAEFGAAEAARVAQTAAAGGTAGDEATAGARVRLTAVRAEDLPDMDEGPGHTDPYLQLDYEGDRFETSVSGEEDGFAWGDSFVIDAVPGGILTVTLFDEDTTFDEKMGVLTTELPPVAPGEAAELVLSFRDGLRGRVVLRVEGLHPGGPR